MNRFKEHFVYLSNDFIAKSRRPWCITPFDADRRPRCAHAVQPCKEETSGRPVNDYGVTVHPPPYYGGRVTGRLAYEPGGRHLAFADHPALHAAEGFGVSGGQTLRLAFHP